MLGTCFGWARAHDVPRPAARFHCVVDSGAPFTALGDWIPIWDRRRLTLRLGNLLSHKQQFFIEPIDRSGINSRQRYCSEPSSVLQR